MEKVEKQTEYQLVVLTKEELVQMQKTAAEIGAAAAMERLEQEKKTMYHKAVDRRLRNTKLLLRNYRMLRENADNSVYGRSQMEESAADILCSMMNLYDDEVIVDAIKRSATRTAIIVSHIETMLELYRAYCERSGNELDIRRYKIVEDMYIVEHPMAVKEIAKMWNMSKENVYSDLKIATERLSALIFGVDGLCLQ